MNTITQSVDQFLYEVHTDAICADTESLRSLIAAKKKLLSAIDSALTDAYAQGRKDQRDEDATNYAREQCETAHSLEQMPD